MSSGVAGTRAHFTSAPVGEGPGVGARKTIEFAERFRAPRAATRTRRAPTAPFGRHLSRPAVARIAYDVVLGRRGWFRLVAGTLEVLDPGGAPRLRSRPRPGSSV
jgi:hypothetical protein